MSFGDIAIHEYDNILFVSDLEPDSLFQSVDLTPEHHTLDEMLFNEDNVIPMLYHYSVLFEITEQLSSSQEREMILNVEDNNEMISDKDITECCVGRNHVAMLGFYSTRGPDEFSLQDRLSVISKQNIMIRQDSEFYSYIPGWYHLKFGDYVEHYALALKPQVIVNGFDLTKELSCRHSHDIPHSCNVKIGTAWDEDDVLKCELIEGNELNDPIELSKNNVPSYILNNADKLYSNYSIKLISSSYMGSAINTDVVQSYYDRMLTQ